MIWEKFYVEIQGGQVTPIAPSWERPCLRVAGFPGHWVAGSQNMTHFHVWFPVQQSYGRRALSFAGPTAWNPLPDFIRDPTSNTDMKLYNLHFHVNF